ncbi:S-adenosyl-L-methionine-dependent methyltransferase [Scenedesmus sp. NREL 46B-D3]|nr:S-adenosyl-L-methionine-dependent methyltransferase [Scenedesmus sp. NREL 46B-D3]
MAATGKPLVTLDLFSGIAGITHALQGIVAPAMYCDIDKYAHKVLARLMSKGLIPKAPVWDDVRTLGKAQLAGKQIDMIVSSWPCVGFSNMGKRAHFEEAGSSLFYETMRLVDIAKPKAIFFENVPQVMQELAEVREQLVVKRKFQLRWCIVPAYAVGAHHSRERWFCLATRPGFRLDVASPGLRFKHRVDWAKEPARTSCTVTQAEVNLRCFALGNAVVPECVRKAFFYLASGGRQQDALAPALAYRPSPLVRPLAATAAAALPRFGFVDAGTNALYPMEPMALPPKHDLKLVFDPTLVELPARVSFDQRHPVLEQPQTAALWATPRAGMTQAGCVLTERLCRDLPSQVRFERRTANRMCPTSPEWVEWLMGFPCGWTLSEAT